MRGERLQAARRAPRRLRRRDRRGRAGDETAAGDPLARLGTSVREIAGVVLRSRPSAFVGRQQCGRWLDNRAENSHQPFRRREGAMAKFRDIRTLQKFAAVHASIQNHFHQDRHLSRREVVSRKTHAMDQATPSAPTLPLSDVGADWFDPLEDAVRGQVRAFIEPILEGDHCDGLWPPGRAHSDPGRAPPGAPPASVAWTRRSDRWCWRCRGRGPPLRGSSQFLL
jgi:hypothetical protein